MSSTAALRQVLRRVGPRASAPRAQRRRALPRAPMEWFNAEDDDGTRAPAAAAGSGRDVARQQRRRRKRNNPVSDIRIGSDAHDPAEDAGTEPDLAQFWEKLDRVLSDLDLDSGDADAPQRQGLTAAALAGAVSQLGRKGDPDAAVAFAARACADEALVLPEATGRITHAAVRVLAAHARVPSALEVVASAIDAGRPVSAATVAAVAQGFVRWGPRMNSSFCRVALAELLLEYHRRSSSSATPTPALRNAVLQLAAQARSRRRFFQFAEGTALAPPPPPTLAGDDVTGSDAARAAPFDGTATRVLLRAVREERELHEVLRAISAPDDASHGGMVEDMDAGAGGGLGVGLAAPPHALLRQRNAETALEYVRALLRCGRGVDAVQALYRLHGRGLLPAPAAWNAVLGHFSRRCRRGDADAATAANNVFRKMCQENVPLCSRGLKAYGDMLMSTSSPLSAASQAVHNRHHDGDDDDDDAGAHFEAALRAAAGQSGGRLGAVLEHMQSGALSASALLRLYAAVAHADAGSTGDAASGGGAARRQRVVRLWKRTHLHPAAPRGLFQALSELMPVRDAAVEFDELTAHHSGGGAGPAVAVALGERDLTHALKVARGNSRDDLAKACDALFVMGSRGVPPTELFVQRAVGLVHRIALSEHRLSPSSSSALSAASPAAAPAPSSSSSSPSAIDAAARADLLRKLSAIWFPDAAAPKAPVPMLEQICAELLRASSDAVWGLAQQHQEERQGDVAEDERAAATGAEADRLREECEVLEERLCMLLDVWDPKELVA